MQDREFEKKVHQQMQEFRVAPRPDVWARVRDDLRRKKRRRPVVFWILLAGLLTGASAWLLYGLQTGSDNTLPYASHNNPVKAPAATSQSPASLPATKDIQETKPSKTTYTKPGGNSAAGPSAHASTANTVSGNPKNGITRHTTSGNRQPWRTTGSKNIVARTGNTTRKPALHNPVITAQPDAVQHPAAQTTIPPVKTDDIAIRHANIGAWQRMPTTFSINPAAPAAPIVPAEQSGKTHIAKRKMEPQWQWGIQAGAGISDLAMEVLRGTSVADYAFSNTGNLNGPVAPPVAAPRASAVTSGAAFQLGGYVSRSVSRRLRLKAGLSYEYYSNNIAVGDYVPAVRVVNQGFGSMTMVNEYYLPGGNNKYVNKYHFAALPVSLQWQVNKHAKRQLVWENGITLSRMLHSNALVYDGRGGAYYKDDNVLSKTQWTFSSSLLFSIKNKSNVQFYAGPHFQYGLGDLMKDSDKHLRYAGIRIAAGFNKK